ncbi:MAG: glutamate-5-semialdehyde dehydrogenase [Prevotella sp.]|nr:glutamate-5-semialdehyde dehydrogenase [Prevotella sp.]
MEMKEMFERVKRASRGLTLLTDEARNSVLIDVAQAIVDRQETILSANADDLSRMDPANPLYDRLQLTPARLEAIAQDMRNVATLPTPLGHVTKQKTLPNGLRLCRVSVPFGVIGMIYEARPNVTFDVFSLCFKSGNACVLKGGKDADSSNRAAVEVIHDVLCSHGLDPDVVTLLPATHEATGAMLTAVGYIDLCIPRGGRRLIDFVRDNARVPVIETGAGVVHTYFDKDGDLEMGRRIVCNAKTRRVSVCNALDSLIIHRSRLKDLPALVEPLLTHTPPVTLYLDDEAYNALTSASLSAAATIPSPSGEGPSASVATIPSPSGEGPSAALLQKATVDSYGTEFMDYKMAVKTVGSLDEALDHIGRYGSGHSEAIVTASEEAARRFQQHVDAACVYWNAPTSFTDGAQFGLGAEIGISTQKLGPRGPMALEEITTYKWLIEGEGQTRP